MSAVPPKSLTRSLVGKKGGKAPNFLFSKAPKERNLSGLGIGGGGGLTMENDPEFR